MEQREMDNLEKVAQLVDKAGCSYMDAKEALEKSDWNLLDAMIALEEEGKVVKPAEPEVIPAEDAEHIKPDGFKNEKKDSYGKGNFGDDARHYRRQAADATKSFFARAKDALTRNYMTVLGRSGNQVLHVPMWVLLILLICWFWGVIGLALVMMVFGCRFHFEGQDFGKINVNETMDKASQKVYETGQRVHEEFSGKREEDRGTGVDDGEYKG